MIQETGQGMATDINGYYIIQNILHVEMGYLMTPYEVHLDLFLNLFPTSLEVYQE